MKKQDVRIMIIEDDAQLGKALNEALTRAGYAAELFARPDDAINASKRQSYPVVISDCMLPKMHGVDLTQALKAEGAGQLCVILTSGIFKDKNFIKEALQKSGAKHFLTKPFELSDLLSILEQEIAEVAEEAKEPVFEILTKPNASPREIRKAIEALESINGYDLPYIYCLLLDSKISGHLNIINEKGAVSGITFAAGKILNVDVPDKTTFLGALLVEKGFLTPANLHVVTSIPNERRLGERLIEANFLSPHALPIALSEQMIIRLGRTIDSLPVRMNFVPSDIPETEPNIDNQSFTPFLHEWFFSKIKAEWFETFYRSWLDHKLQRGANFAKSGQLLSLPVFEKLPGVLDFVLTNQTVGKLVEQQKYPDELLYRALHLLLVRRIVSFDEKKQVADVSEISSRLKKLASGMKGKNFFEVFEMLGVSRKAKPAELQKAYRDFSKLYHPDRLTAQNLPADLQAMATDVYAQITRAYKILTDDTAKATYIQELEKVEASKQFEAESIFEEARQNLQRNNTKKAAELLDTCCSLVEPTSEMRLYRIWARIKLAEASTTPAPNLATQVEDELTAIPPEDRHNATYFMVKGLFEKLTGNLDMARRNFEHAKTLDPNLVDAKREFNILQLKKDSAKPQGVLNADLKDVFGLLFGKKRA